MLLRIRLSNEGTPMNFISLFLKCSKTIPLWNQMKWDKSTRLVVDERGGPSSCSSDPTSSTELWYFEILYFLATKARQLHQINIFNVPLWHAEGKVNLLRYLEGKTANWNITKPTSDLFLNLSLLLPLTGVPQLNFPTYAAFAYQILYVDPLQSLAAHGAKHSNSIGWGLTNQSVTCSLLQTKRSLIKRSLQNKFYRNKLPPYSP